MFRKHQRSKLEPERRVSGDLYFHAFERASIPTLICDQRGCILEVNAAFTSLLGYSSEELIDKRVSEITHAADMEDHLGRMTRLISGAEDSLRAEKRYLRKDGSTVWGAISVAVVRNGAEKPAYIISQIRDITAERRTREKLQESEGRLQAILDNSDAVIYAKDLVGHYMLVNRRFEEIFHLRRDQIIGNTDHEIFPAEMADAFAANDRRVAEEGRGIQFEEQAPLADGVHTYVSVKFPLRNLRGQTVAVCGISTDITDRKLSEEAMKDLNDRMLRANDELKRVQMQLIQVEKLESLGRLAAGVAHEVKNPLAMLQLGVDYLEGNVASDDPNVPTILGEMREAIVRAEKIIHGMVDFSADRRLNLQQHHINDIIAGAEMLARHELTRHSIRLCHDLAPELPPVFVDGTKIEQVLLNIMMNAIHAMTPQGSGKLLLKSSISRAGTMERDEGARTADHLRGGDSVVIVEVSDSGPGIPADILPKIFDPFFTTKATGEGTGLGLAVVKKIIDLHKGLIKIENRPEGGARVTLTLRAAAPQSGPAQPKPEVSYSI